MYVNLVDMNFPETSPAPNEWRYFPVTLKNCRRRKGSANWSDLDILLPALKEELSWCRFNVHFHVPSLDFWENLFAVITYTRYALIGDSISGRDAFHRVFCTNAEMEAFMKLRYPKMSEDERQEVLTLWRNEEYRDRSGKLCPCINIPEPYKSKLYSGEFDEPWTKIVL